MENKNVKKVITTEHQEQCKVIEWVKWQESHHKELKLLYAIPNGGYRHKATAVALKAEGVKSGVPDLHLPVARRGYNSLFIEMKNSKGTVSKNQKEWISELVKENNYCIVCKSNNEAIDVLMWYLNFDNSYVSQPLVD